MCTVVKINYVVIIKIFILSCIRSLSMDYYFNHTSISVMFFIVLRFDGGAPKILITMRCVLFIIIAELFDRNNIHNSHLLNYSTYSLFSAF